MSIYFKAIALTIFFILITACGTDETTTTSTAPAVTPSSSAMLSASPTLTPQVAEPTAVPAPTSEPANNGISFVDSGQRLGEANSWDVALGDLDGDGDLDAFVANSVQGGAKNAVWINDGRGSFTHSEQLGYGQGVALGDVDGDGDLDAVTTHWTENKQSAVWLNDGSGLFTDSGQNLGFAFSPALGDVDGDGDLDIYLAQMAANTVWLNDGSGVFSDTGQRLSTAITAAVVLDDLDGDGDLDALAGGWDEPAKVWLNDGAGAFTEHEQTLSSASVHIHDLALGDVDGDGDLDAFTAVASGDPNQVWLNDGGGAFSDNGQQLYSSLAHGVALGDIDGDGDLDALTMHGDRWRDSFGGKIWLNDGTGQFEESEAGLGDLYSSQPALGDLDGDGDLDAFLAHGEMWQENGGELPNTVWLWGQDTSTATGATQEIAPIIDGALSPGEWDTAVLENLSDGSELFLMQDGDYLYLAVRSVMPEMIGANVFIADGNQVRILHTSAALGTAVYQQNDDTWQKTHDFDWQCRSTGDSTSAQAERAAYLLENGWLAANSRMGTPNELEYQIKLPSAPPYRIAVSVFRSSVPDERVIWPHSLTDATTRPNPGGLPAEMDFALEQWATFQE
jgi:hypothetical protein